MTLSALPILGTTEYRDYRRRAIFSCHKWDPQVEDVSTIAPFALALPADTWRELAQLAEALAAETVACEAALWRRPDLHAHLGISLPLRLALSAQRSKEMPRAAARVMRFDLHPTRCGWALSEVNSDVPGGYNEASGLTALMQEHHPDCAIAGDPTATLADRIAACAHGVPVALVHCSAYSDDRQVIEYLADRLQVAGVTCHACAPDAISWRGAEASIGGEPIGALMRFFPAEWLPRLPLRSQWWRYFAPGGPPAANPGSALLVQSKRLPLVWERLGLPLPAWRSVLPETCAPEEVPALDEEWLLKPAWGRVGEGVLGRGFGVQRDWQKAVASARRWPRHWVAQRRFESLAIPGPQGPLHACLGIYTVDGAACGIYGRITTTPPIDRYAQEVAVLIAPRREQGRGAA